MTDRLKGTSGFTPDWDLNGPPKESHKPIPGLQRLEHLGQSMLRLQMETREENGIEGNFILGED